MWSHNREGFETGADLDQKGIQRWADDFSATAHLPCNSQAWVPFISLLLKFFVFSPHLTKTAARYGQALLCPSQASVFHCPSPDIIIKSPRELA